MGSLTFEAVELRAGRVRSSRSVRRSTASVAMNKVLLHAVVEITTEAPNFSLTLRILRWG